MSLISQLKAIFHSEQNFLNLLTLIFATPDAYNFLAEYTNSRGPKMLTL